MCERPILFSGPLVRAILEGRKTQTRRLLNPRGFHPYEGDQDDDGMPLACWKGSGCPARIPSPFGRPGDRLWVRETFHTTNAGQAVYRADYPANALARDMENIPPEDAVRWTPSIHMPRWASRINLGVTEVRVERLQAITEEDARAEGAYEAITGRGGQGHINDLDRWARYTRRTDPHARAGTMRGAFAALWDGIYAAAPWHQNPWVWVVSFKKLEAA